MEKTARAPRIFKYKNQVQNEENGTDNCTDEALRKVLASNLKTAYETWKIKKGELMGMIAPGMARNTGTNVFQGSTQLPLSALVRLERVSGIGISVWLTRSIGPEELPAQPLDANTSPARPVEVAHALRLFKNELILKINQME